MIVIVKIIIIIIIKQIFTLMCRNSLNIHISYYSLPGEKSAVSMPILGNP